MAHLTSQQRYTIEQLLKAKKSQQYIADIIGKDKSVVSREIKRNSMYNGIYKSDNAQSYYLFNREKSRRKSKWTLTLQEEIIKTLKEDKSPEQVVGIRKKINKTPYLLKVFTPLFGRIKRMVGVFIPICAMELKDTENEVITRTIEVLSKTK